MAPNHVDATSASIYGTNAEIDYFGPPCEYYEYNYVEGHGEAIERGACWLAALEKLLQL